MENNKDKINVYFTGNTVKLEAKFYGLAGDLIDVQVPKVIIYDYQYNKLEEQLLNDSNKEEIGIYFYNYKTDKTPKRIIYEFYGELNGFPTIERGTFITKFI